MKNLSFLATLILSIGILSFVGCTDEETTPNVVIDIPDSFTVDIPASISNASNGSLSGRIAGDGDGLIEGGDLYQAVPFFIYIGEESARIIETIIPIGAQLAASNIKELVYVSDDDGREKLVTINNDVLRGGKSYAYELTTFDVASGEQALQMLWNTGPVEGVAILNPYNIDRSDPDAVPDAFLRIDYSEDDPNYEATMVVSISGLVPENVGDIDNLKIFAGRNGDIVDVIGNSNHPGLVLFDENFDSGRNYAFVGRGDDANNIGIINLALPPSNITTNDALENYSIYDVLFEEIDNAVGGFLTPENIADILAEAESPAYFNEIQGFIAAGEENQPTDAGFTTDFVDISGLKPFIPNDIKTLDVNFLTN